MNTKPLYPEVTVVLPENLSFVKSLQRVVRRMSYYDIPDVVIDQYTIEVQAYGPGFLRELTKEYVTVLDD